MSGAIVFPPRIFPNGDSALTVEFGDVISDDINDHVLALDLALRQSPVIGIRETVPTYRSLLIHYDPIAIGFDEMCGHILALSKTLAAAIRTNRRWRIPVVYGGEFGIDLEDVARSHAITADEVVRLHTASTYRVSMIGFTPGFTYLSGLDARLATPRRPNPRVTTPAGTVSIGGQQAGIQCLAGPSGWHLLGRTPVRTFQPGREPMFLIEPGDTVSFFAIEAAEFADLERCADKGEPVAQLIDA